MEPGQLIFSRLSQAPSVGGQLQHVRDGQPEVKIYPVLAPPDTPRPYLTYQLISNVPDDSAVCELDDLARVQISIFADSYAGICGLANAIRRQLHRTETAGTYLLLTNEFDHEQPGALCFFRSQDYEVEHTPA
ncbi:tail completion protein gp17 [Hymenobacter negativus]|uniref:DUF3168 domain-containing protein n=1 Tax=Hymenobacter negativus TaxID=2795026 RepID=A0ABS0Q9H2_9BACT|nr:DUF3168 domain-containing protein [Hymenobacter negativus]MBH8558993.1 DUF3168 domain-containing protein [Hymenobacter negativus]